MQTELTPDQRRQLPKYQEHWLLKVGCNTQPADRVAAENAVMEAYDLARIKPPRRVIWVRSPLEAPCYIPDIEGEDPAPEVGKPVWLDVLDRTRSQVVNQIVKRIGHPLFKEIEGEFLWPLLDNIRATMNSERNDLMRSHGCHGADAFGALDFYQNILGIKDVEMMRGIIGAAKAAAWWWPFSKACVIMERPARLEHDGRNLHCKDGPALAFPDGTEYYVWHGIEVQEEIIKHPEQLRVGEILTKYYGSDRRCALERYHMNRFNDPF